MSDNLPPELDELGKRMRTDRPVASDRALDRVMTRAQGARRTRKTSLLWRSSAPRTPRKTIALVCAALVTTGGMAATANAGLLDTLLGGNIPLVSSLLGSKAAPAGNCNAGGLVAVGANALGDCSGKKGTNCSAAGLVAVGANVLGDCSGKKGSSSLANCSAAGAVAVGANVLGDCSNAAAEPSSDAAATEYAADCDGLINAKATLLDRINALLVVLPGLDRRIVDLRVKVDALDTDIHACVNLP